jgi:hypothetical protein
MEWVMTGGAVISGALALALVFLAAAEKAKRP